MALFGKKKPVEETLAEGRTLFEQGNRKKAFLTLHGLAAKGNPEACYYIGRYYLEEQQNPELGESFLQKAAKGGYVGAAEILAKQFGPKLDTADESSESEGTRPLQATKETEKKTSAAEQQAMSKEETEALLKKATNAYKSGEYETAIHIWRDLAEKGDAQAQNNLGVCYVKGDGTGRDIPTAVVWFRRAAEQGYAKAMWNLGRIMEQDNGVGPDLAEAARWYRMAAENGHSRAAVNLGLAYDNGDGVRKDATEAVRWYQMAANLGDAVGMRYLGISYEEGSGVGKDLQRAFALYRQASDLGDELSMYYVGLGYEKGIGIPQDLKQAETWYRKAADQGEARGAAALSLLYLEGRGVEENLEEALRWAEQAQKGGFQKADELLEKVQRAKGAAHNAREEAKRKAEEEAKQAEKKPPQETVAPDRGPLSSEEAYAEGMRQFRGGNYEAALPLLERVCPFFGPRKNRYPDAQAALAQLQERGICTEQDEDEALWRYRIAARAGNPDGAEGLMRLLTGNEKGTPEECQLVLNYLKTAFPSGKEAEKRTWEENLEKAREREKINQLELTDNHVYELYKACLATDETPENDRWSDYDTNKLQENKERIRFLLGQLACVHQKTDETVPIPIDEKLCIDYRGKKWAFDLGNPIRLLNMGIRTNDVYLKKEGEAETVTFGYSVSKTLSPKDPEFSLWFLIWQGNKKAVDGKYAEAYQFYTKAAEAGYPKGEYELGYYYGSERLSQGAGIQKDDEKSYQWYKKAADQGYTPAQIACGTIFRDGIGRKIDYDQALAWYQKAADQGDSNAVSACETVRNMIEAQKGDKEAQFKTGKFYLNKWDTKASVSLPWFEKSAAKKHQDANFYCGIIYGLLLEPKDQDQEKALHYLQAADRLGHALSGKIAKLMRPGGLFNKEKKTCQQALELLLHDYGEEKISHEDMKLLLDLYMVLPQSVKAEMHAAQAKRLRALANRL